MDVSPTVTMAVGPLMCTLNFARCQRSIFWPRWMFVAHHRERTYPACRRRLSGTTGHLTATGTMD